MKTPTCPLSTFPSRPSHCRCTPAAALPFLANPDGSKTITPSGVPIAADLARQLVHQGPLVQLEEPTKCWRGHLTKRTITHAKSG